jgi:cytidylate kinase
MPATSQQQQKLFGLALSVKRGETSRSEVSDEVLNIVDTMSEKKIKDFAETSHKGLPTKVETVVRNLVRETFREKVLRETVNTKNIGVDTVLNFKDGEVWRVTKVIGNTSNPRGFFVKPHDAKTKKANTSIEIELKPDFLQKNLKSINEATDIKIGDKIKIYDTQSGEILAKITSIINKNRIEVKYKNLTLYAEKEKSGRWSIDESINEATPIQKIFRKIGWGGDGWTPQDYARQIKDLSDDTLKIWYDSAKSNKGIPNTPLAFQQKLTKIEMEKRGLLETVNESPTIIEGVDDPGILKCIFMAGGPGSGKSFVANDIFGIGAGLINTAASGLKVVASDVAFEAQLKKHGINPKDLADIERDNPELWGKIGPNPDSIRNKAKGITDKQQKFYQEGRLGMIMDGTAQNHSKIASQKKEAENMGYDCYMVFVNTSLEVAKERNLKRSRTLPDSVLTQSWKDAQENLSKYRQIFGKNLIVVDNTVYKPIDSSVKKAVSSFVRQPVSNPIGKEWIANARLLKKRGLI